MANPLGNSVDRIFTANAAGAYDYEKIKKDLTKAYGKRSAVTHLINSTNSRCATTMCKEAANWVFTAHQRNEAEGTITDTEITFNNAPKCSAWDRFKHKWNMHFDSKYKNAFNLKINGLVESFKAANGQSPRVNEYQLERDAIVQAREAAVNQNANIAALDAIIAGHPVLIAHKNEELEDLGRNYNASVKIISDLQQDVDIFNDTIGTDASQLCQKFDQLINARISVFNDNEEALVRDIVRLLRSIEADVGAIPIFQEKLNELNIVTLTEEQIKDLVRLPLFGDHTAEGKAAQASFKAFLQWGQETQAILAQSIPAEQAIKNGLRDQMEIKGQEVEDLQAELAQAQVARAALPAAAPAAVEVADLPGLSVEENGLYQGLSVSEREIYRNLADLNGVNPSPAFADIVMEILMGRSAAIIVAGNTFNIHHIDSSKVPVTVNGVQGNITLPRAFSLDKLPLATSTEWTVNGQLVLEVNGKKLNLDGLRIIVSANEIVCKLKSSNQSWMQRHFGLNKLTFTLAEVQTIFRDGFVGE